MATIHDVADYLLHDAAKSGQRLRHMKLQKLCYYAQGFWLAIAEGDPLFDEEFSAWQYGPVSYDLWRRFRSFRSSPIPAPAEYPEVLTGNERTFLDLVIARFEGHHDLELSTMTHREDPWRDTRERMRDGGDDTISKDALYRWFRPRIWQLSVNEAPAPPTPDQVKGMQRIGQSLPL